MNLVSRRQSMQRALGATAALISGCQWLGPDPVSRLQKLLSYVTTFLELAQAIWSQLAPFLPATMRPQADADFTSAVATLTNAEAAAQDALQIYQSGSGPAPNWDTLTKAIQDACANLLAIYQRYSQPVGDDKRERMHAGESELARMQLTIAHW